MLAKQSRESWGTGSLPAPAMEIRAKRGEKKHLERLASNSPTTSFLTTGCRVPGLLTPLPQHDVFVVSARLLPVEAAWRGKEELHHPAEISILSTPVLELRQLQLALEAFPGGLGEVWVSGSSLRPQQGVPRRAETTGTSPEPCRMRPQLVQAHLHPSGRALEMQWERLQHRTS